MWQCNDKYKHKDNKCPTPNFSEDELKELFVGAVNELIIRKDLIINNFEEVMDTAFDISEEQINLNELKEKRIHTTDLMERLATENATRIQDQKAYQKRFNELSVQYSEISKNIKAVEDDIRDKKHREAKAKIFLKTLKKQNQLVTHFSEDLWHALFDHAAIYSKKDIQFIFRYGMKVRV